MTLTLVCIVWFVVACIAAPVVGGLFSLGSEDAGDFDLHAAPLAASAVSAAGSASPPLVDPAAPSSSFRYEFADVPEGVTLRDWRQS